MLGCNNIKLAPLFSSFWAGMVVAISFLEAWLKFQAEGVTLQIGLSIGKLVYSALNRVELILMVLIWVVLLPLSRQMGRVIFQNFIFCIVTVILLVQTVFLLPVLTTRADLIVDGFQPGASHVHFWYVGLEIAKVVLLIIFSVNCRFGTDS